MKESLAVQPVPCTSWEHFKSQLLPEYSELLDGGSPLFRGHSQPEWKLASPWERKLASLAQPHKVDTQSRLLTELLENFKDLATGLPGVRTSDLSTEDDWWTLGRHYGLTTPLLDWTKSPYVAAFFAFTGFLEQISSRVTATGEIDLKNLLSSGSMDHVAIWSFRMERAAEKVELPEHLEIMNARTDIGHRQRAQRGVFTRLTHEKYFCLEDYLETFSPQNPPLRKYLIPAREAARAITELRMMNITYGTLFPDLAGAALQANFEMASLALIVYANLKADIWEFLSKDDDD